ncbi:MAG: prephenate dehydrogenase/arogenate dehydrogenase family protein [Leadbetterella sp.]
MRIGIVGLGDMGKLFAIAWANQGHHVSGVDTPKNFSNIQSLLEPYSISVYHKVEEILPNIDFLLICVETSKISELVKSLSSKIKKPLIISAQTSVKAPEAEAFDQYLPVFVEVVGSHALFGPQVSLSGQNVALFNHRASESSFDMVSKLYKDLGCNIVVLKSAKEHDKLMADVQVVTHIGFESLGTAFMHRKSFPWETENHVRGIDNIKILLTMRIYSYKPHVYAGLAFYNPYAAADVRGFAKAETELFGYMISENKQKLETRVRKAIDKIFDGFSSTPLVSNDILDEFSLNPEKEHKPNSHLNSHLSLLSMLCTWADLDSKPYDNLICQTPPFRLRVGLVEYLCRNEDLLNESINTAVYDKSIRKDDLAYHTAVHEWANILEVGDENIYIKHFNQTKKFLQPRLEEGLKLSNELISKLY